MGPRRLPTLLLTVSCFVLCGNRSNCDSRTPTLTCTPQNITLQQGQCVPLSNPCGADWVSQDGFTLCNEPAGLSSSTTRVRGVTTRQLCASSTMPSIANATVGFIYSLFDDFGEGNLVVTVGSPLSVVASASPQTISSGQGSFLNATVTGGAAPFTYAWSPANTLNDATIANPTAFPIASAVYTVVVTDALGQTASASVNVAVTSALVVTANPSTLSVGQSSQLTVTYPGGIPPFTYAWTPANGTLSSQTSANPIAVPATTTTYNVTVTDGVGAVVNGSVTVTVLLRVFASSNPSIITPGGSSQLVVAASGGSPPYLYNWTENGPGGTLNNPAIATPIATPAATTTYTVTVTDSAGQTGSRNVNITVNGVALNVCFNLSPAQPLAGQNFTIDMSCSSGNISVYRVWLNYSLGAPPSYAGAFAQYTTLQETPATFNNVRIEVEDVGGNTSFIDTVISVQ